MPDKCRRRTRKKSALGRIETADANTGHEIITICQRSQDSGDVPWITLKINVECYDGGIAGRLDASQNRRMLSVVGGELDHAHPAILRLNLVRYLNRLVPRPVIYINHLSFAWQVVDNIDQSGVTRCNQVGAVIERYDDGCGKGADTLAMYHGVRIQCLCFENLVLSYRFA